MITNEEIKLIRLGEALDTRTACHLADATEALEETARALEGYQPHGEYNFEVRYTNRKAADILEAAAEIVKKVLQENRAPSH